MKRNFQARFYGFYLDSVSGLKHEAAGDVKLAAKELAVLVELVIHAGKLVTKADLVKAVWGDYSASDSSIARCISAIKSKLKAADQESDTLIRMIYGKGYKFTGAVTSSASFLCEESFSTLINTSPDCIIFKDGEGRWLAANHAALETFALSQIDWQAKTDMELAELLPASYRPALEACVSSDASAWQNALPSQQLEVVCLDDGSQRIFDTTKSPLYHPDGRRNLLVIFGHDVTDLLQASAQQQVSEQVLANSSEAVLITDANNHIVSVNRAFSRMTGYSAEEVMGKNPSLLSSAHHDADFYRDMWSKLNTEGAWLGEICNRKKNGELYKQVMSLCAVKSHDGQLSNHIAIYSDSKWHPQTAGNLEFLAYHDPLTRLPNRMLLHDRFHHAIARAQRENTLIAVLFIDLDKFKLINDTLGHHIGDRLLKMVAHRLEQCVRRVDTVSRIGGDEFIILLTSIESQASVAQIAQKIVDEMSRPITIDKTSLMSPVSIGISIYPHDGQDIDGLLRMADTSMYKAKNSGRSTYRFFNAPQDH